MDSIAQQFIERIYGQIDQANKELLDHGSSVRIVRSLEVTIKPSNELMLIDTRSGSPEAVAVVDVGEPISRAVNTGVLAAVPNGMICDICGGLMKQDGTCSTCTNCGSTSGCS